MAQDTILGTDSVKDALKVKVNDDMTELFLIKTEVEAARDGESSLLDQIDDIQSNVAALTVGTGCPVSSNDANPGYLNGKLVAGEAIDLTEGSDGGDETLTISCENASTTNKGVVELTTSAEATAGVDTTRAVTAVALNAAMTQFLRSHFLL